jgi:hypothetical protein
MSQSGRGPGLQPDLAGEIGIAGEVSGKHLDGHLPTKYLVERSPDHGHTARTQAFHDPVPAADDFHAKVFPRFRPGHTCQRREKQIRALAEPTSFRDRGRMLADSDG